MRFLGPFLFLVSATLCLQAGEPLTISPQTLLSDPAHDPAWSPLFTELAPDRTRQSNFEERRFFPFRQKPVVLKGEIRIVPDRGLSLRYLEPTPQTLIIDREGLLLRDDNGRERAALALGSRQVSEAIPVLLAMVVAGRSDVEAAEVLGSLARATSRVEDLVRDMRAELDRTADPAARLRITQALAEIPGDAARAALTGLATDSDRTVAATAVAITRARARRRGKG